MRQPRGVDDSAAGVLGGARDREVVDRLRLDVGLGAADRPQRHEHADQEQGDRPWRRSGRSWCAAAPGRAARRGGRRGRVAGAPAGPGSRCVPASCSLTPPSSQAPPPPPRRPVACSRLTPSRRRRPVACSRRTTPTRRLFTPCADPPSAVRRRLRACRPSTSWSPCWRCSCCWPRRTGTPRAGWRPHRGGGRRRHARHRRTGPDRGGRHPAQPRAGRRLPATILVVADVCARAGVFVAAAHLVRVAAAASRCGCSAVSSWWRRR